MRRAYAKKRDLSEPAIVAALESIGAKVYRELPVDLLVHFRGRFYCLEVKTPTPSGKTPKDKRQIAQNEFIELTGTPVVATPEAALEALA